MPVRVDGPAILPNLSGHEHTVVPGKTPGGAARRRRPVRARTIKTRQLAHRSTSSGAERLPSQLPATRGQCVSGPRPCPHVSCRHHLYLDVSPRSGTIKLNFPHLEVWELPVSCALDVAERGGSRLEDISHLMNVTRERIRQIEVEALARLAAVVE